MPRHKQEPSTTLPTAYKQTHARCYCEIPLDNADHWCEAKTVGGGSQNRWRKRASSSDVGRLDYNCVSMARGKDSRCAYTRECEL